MMQEKSQQKSLWNVGRTRDMKKAKAKDFELTCCRMFFVCLMRQNALFLKNRSILVTLLSLTDILNTTHVMIEQKSLGKDLKKAIRQSDCTYLSPFQLAKRYSAELAYDDRPRWIVTCNFSEFLVYDMNKPNSESEQIFLKNRPKDYYRCNSLFIRAMTVLIEKWKSL